MLCCKLQCNNYVLKILKNKSRFKFYNVSNISSPEGPVYTYLIFFPIYFFYILFTRVMQKLLVQFRVLMVARVMPLPVDSLASVLQGLQVVTAQST